MPAKHCRCFFHQLVCVGVIALSLDVTSSVSVASVSGPWCFVVHSVRATLPGRDVCERGQRPWVPYM